MFYPPFCIIFFIHFYICRNRAGWGPKDQMAVCTLRRHQGTMGALEGCSDGTAFYHVLFSIPTNNSVVFKFGKGEGWG